MAHIYNGILLSQKKEWNWVICRDVDGYRDGHTEWSKSEKETQISLLAHICGIWKKIGIDNLIYKAEIETQL